MAWANAEIICLVAASGSSAIANGGYHMVVPCGTSILGKAAKTALVGDMFGERSCVTFIGFLDPVRARAAVDAPKAAV
ncbi:MAG: hypothetical protein AAAC47_12790 [Pararhizobium sp.]